MIRHWATVMQGGREIERPVYTNDRGSEYVRIHGKKMYLDRLMRDGRVVERYDMGRENDDARTH